MATDVSPTVLRGLAIPADVELSDSATATQAGPGPGPATDTSDPPSQMKLSGTSEQEDITYDVLAKRGGFPGVSGRGTWVWKESTDSSSEYRGWDPPGVISAMRNTATTRGTASYCHAIGLSDGDTLMTLQVEVDSGTDYYITTNAYEEDNASVVTFGSIDLEMPTASYNEPKACLCEVPAPEGTTRVLMFVWDVQTTGTEGQIRTYFTDDLGSTWTLAEREALLESLDTTSATGAGNPGHVPGRPRAAYKDGQILLISEALQSNTTPAYRDVFIQWASDDGGLSFAHVDTWGGVASAADDTGGKYHDIVVSNGYFCLYYVAAQGTGTPYLPAYRRIANAQDTIRNVLPDGLGFTATTDSWAAASGTPLVFSDGDLAAWKTRDGAVYVAGRVKSISTQWFGVVVQSKDGGQVFEWLGQSSALVGQPGILWGTTGSLGSKNYLTAFAGAPQGARSVLVGVPETTAGTFDGDARILYLGGDTQVTLPALSSTNGDDRNRVGYEIAFLPWSLPTTQGWAATGAGTGTLTASQINISTVAQQLYYSVVPAGLPANGLILNAEVSTPGGVLFAPHVGLRMVIDDGASDYDITFRFSSTGIRLVDNNGASLGDVVIDVSLGVEILVGLDRFGGVGKVDAYYRARSEDPGDREWTLGWSTTALVDGGGGGGGGSHLIVWGNITSATATSSWYRVQAVSGTYTGDRLTGFTNPDDLHSHPLNSVPVYLSRGTLLQTQDGPALAGETWELPPVFQYPRAAASPLVSPSPRTLWRSTSAAAQLLAWDIGTVGSDALLVGGTIVLLLENINWRTATFRGRTAAGATTTLASVDMATGMTGLSYTRVDDCVYASIGTADSTSWCQRNELAGGSVDLGGGKVRRIRSNTPGIWTDAPNVPMRIFLEGIDGTEGASGTCNIIAPRGVVVVHGVATAYERLELNIAAQVTPDGVTEGGIIHPFVLVPFGCQYSRGRTRSLETNTELQEVESGARFARQVGPARRSASFAWATPIDETQLFQATPSPDYVSGTPGGPAAYVADTAQTVEALIEELDGQRIPAVYLPRIPRGTPDVIHLLRRRDSLYGRLQGLVDLESVLGDEGEDEIWRVQTITISEEV